MPEWLKAELTDGSHPMLSTLIFRMLVAWACGWLVAWVYRKTRAREAVSPSLSVTLVLLAVLIAMVTRVIGDNVARAFSLVGALSIVRFRTVVRDTQDTAFVIFAVAAGMAAGVSDLRVTLVGMLAVTAAAFAMRRPGGKSHEDEDSGTLSVRVGLGRDLDGLLKNVFETSLAHYDMRSVETVRQGAALEANYRVRLRPGRSPAELVKDLNGLEGVLSVHFGRPDEDDD